MQFWVSIFNHQHSALRFQMWSIAAAALFRNNRYRLQYLLLGLNPFSTSSDRLETCRKVGNVDPTESSKSYSTCRPPDGLLARIVSAANVLNISKPIQCDVESSKYLDASTCRPPDGLLARIVSAANVLNISKPTQCDVESSKYLDATHETSESRVDDFQKFVTILVFDIETNGLSTKYARIVEFAVQDLQGGENSTFKTLVNPEESVKNTQVHNITTDMVKSPEVPKFKDVIPILRDYVRTRQEISNTPVLLVAHNGRRFDVPLLINEFKRCSEEIPSDWLFFDTMELAKLVKLKGSKLPSKSLEYLRKHYGIPLVGQPHRAMSDVHLLSEVLRAMTKELKLPLSSLLDNKSFKASDLIRSEHKKGN